MPFDSLLILMIAVSLSISFLYLHINQRQKTADTIMEDEGEDHRRYWPPMTAADKMYVETSSLHPPSAALDFQRRRASEAIY